MAKLRQVCHSAPGRLASLVSDQHATFANGHKPSSIQNVIARVAGNPAFIVGVLLAIATLVIDVIVIQTEPIIFWHDPYTRLAYRDQISVGPWLPLTQFVIFAVTRFTGDLTILRIVFALIAASAVISAYEFVSDLAG